MKAPTRWEWLLIRLRDKQWRLFEWVLLMAERWQWLHHYSRPWDVLERLAGHECHHDGCREIGIPCYIPDWSTDEPDEPVAYYCGSHAKAAGFCYRCGQFWAGVESFDFGPGFCDNCREYDDDEPDWDENDYDPYWDEEEWMP